MNKWIGMILIAGVSFFECSVLYSFVYDLEVRHLWDEYVLENKDPDISVYEWIARQEEGHERFLDWIGDGAASAFDPWYESPYSYGHTERSND